MPISSISSGVSFAPAQELSGKQVKFVKPRIAVDQLIAALPGNSNNQKPQEIRRMAADIAQVSQAFNKKLTFVVDHQSNEVIVKVVDKATNKVIKVLPPEELQRLHRKLKETIGFLFNEQV
ncbi:MAG: flagellar protein FlaG [Treponema sp.]|nr:flagellar protein FlaG [Treponema sp.]